MRALRRAHAADLMLQNESRSSCCGTTWASKPSKRASKRTSPAVATLLALLESPFEEHRRRTTHSPASRPTGPPRSKSAAHHDHSRTENRRRMESPARRERRRARGLRGHAPRRHRTPFTGKYEAHWDDGTYHCVCCGAKLFESATKFDAGCGWPSFSEEAVPGAIRNIVDRSHGMVRTENVCANCGAHLGHVFPDGPDRNRPALLHELGLARLRRTIRLNPNMKLHPRLLPDPAVLRRLQARRHLHRHRRADGRHRRCRWRSSTSTERKLQAMQKATLVLILLFGTLTLALHDDRFIKWKPTVLYGAMAIALAVALWALQEELPEDAAGRAARAARPHLGPAQRRVDRLLPVHGRHQRLRGGVLHAPRPGSTSSSGAMCSRSSSWSRRACTSRRT